MILSNLVGARQADSTSGTMSGTFAAKVHRHIWPTDAL
jgi:hypothetical protein